MDPFDQFAPPDLPPGALCAQADPEAWFPEQGGNPRPAKAICGGCPVITECLAYALPRDEYGTWAATTRLERDVLMGRRPSNKKTNRDRIVARLQDIGVDVEQLISTAEEVAA